MLALLGLRLLAAGVGVSWVHATQRDADGFYTSPTYDLTSEADAITTDDLHLVARPGDWFPAPGELTFRVNVTPGASGGPVFVGLAEQGDVESLLDGVAHSQLTGVGPTSDDLTYRSDPGTVAIMPTST